MNDTIPTITVNGEPVPAQAVSYELQRLVKFHAQHGMPEEQIRQQLPALRDRAIEQAIGEKLLFLEADELDIRVSDQEVDESVFKMAREVGGMEKLRSVLARQNLDERTLREQIRRGKRVDKLVERIVSSSAEPTEEEIQEHFEQHRGEYSKPERVLAQHILITPQGDSPESKEEARRKISAIRERVANGADFAAEAKAHSHCPSKDKGGSLGWFARGMMVPAFESAAFGMKDGEVSDIVETQFGYHIIYRTGHEDAKEADFDEARESVRDFLRHAKRGEALSAHVAELRKKADIQIH